MRILPIPKYDEDSQITVHRESIPRICYGIPVTATNVERTGSVLEALHQHPIYVQPAYYDVALQRKFTRDNESTEMLDLIFNSNVYDIGAIYQFGNISWEIIYMTMTENRDIASTYKKLEKSAVAAIEKTIELYRKLDG